MPRTSDPTVSYHYLPSPTLTKRDAAFPTSPFAHLPTYLILHTSYSPIFSPSTSPIHPSTNPIQPSHPIPSSSPIKTMLPRPATKLHLTIDDITDYERRKAQRDAQQAQQQAQQTQTPQKNFVEEEEEEATRARAKAKLTREHHQRIMGSRT